MGDISKLSGGNPLDPGPGARGPTKPGSDKFKDLMKVGDSEEKQKRGKKRQAESEEELKAELRTGAITPEKALEGARKKEHVPKIQEVGEAEKRQPKSAKQSEEVVAEAAQEIAATKATQAQITQVRIDGELDELETRLETLASQAQLAEAIAEQEEETVQRIEETPHKPIAVKKEKTVETPQPLYPAATTLGPLFIAPPSSTPPAYATLSAEILALFDRMVGVIAVMKDSGITETIIHLNTAEFENSRFAGSQIVIREYSTAPLAYNIELVGTPQNAALFEQNVGSLMRAFQAGNYNFRVSRIDTRILSQRPDKPHFHRKEHPSDQERPQ